MAGNPQERPAICCAVCETGKRGRPPKTGSTAWHRERQHDLFSGDVEPYVCPKCRAALDKGRSVEIVGDDPITGEPVVWRGFGRRPDFADKTTGKLDRWTHQVESIVDALLGADDGPLGRFQSEAHAKGFARRLNAIRNRLFNACRAARAAEQRRAAAGQGEGTETTLCTETQRAEVER